MLQIAFIRENQESEIQALAEWMQNGGEEVDPIELRQENLS
jgi:hypothetical protein